MKKRDIIWIGIAVGIISPVSILIVNNGNPSGAFHSLFSFIHLLAVASVFLTDFNSKHSVQKAFILLAFLVYPFWMIADRTNIFHEKTFLIEIIAGWIYVMGFTGWLYTEKQ